MLLSNPYGFLALLGIPAVLAIHFFQRRSKKVPVSTLFLLQQTQRESASGRRVERLLHSVPLWLQLLMVLLLTWLLIEPRYRNEESTQRIAVVLDSSASMAVFKEKALAKLEAELDGLKGNASGAEYFLLESTPSNPRIYHGDSEADLLRALADWQPADGAHGSRHSLRMARSMVGAEGAVVYLTDTPAESLQYGAHLYAIGNSIGNCGVTGVDFTEKEGELIWQATVKNYSDTAQTREWLIELSSGERSAARALTIPAGAVTVLQGKFPEQSERCRIVLSADAFSIDDVLPMVRPNPKQIFLKPATSESYREFSKKLAESFADVALATDAAEIDVEVLAHHRWSEFPGNAIVFVESKEKASSYLKGAIVAEEHALMDGLNWQSMLVKEVESVEHTAQDQVLLWQGERPLIFLRSVGTQQLVFNFDLSQSNAQKQEAFAVLLWRFLDTLRSEKVGYAAGIVETGQELEIARDAVESAGNLTFQRTDLAGAVLESERILSHEEIRAAKAPGFFSIYQGETLLFSGASYFADTREADFSDCAELDRVSSAVATAVDRHTREDWLWRYVLAFLLVALVLSWCYTGRGNLNQSAKTT